MKWLISIRGTARVFYSGRLAAVHTVIGELTTGTYKVGDGASFTPGMMVAVEQAFEDNDRLTFDPPLRMILETSYVTAMVEMPAQ